MASLIDEYGRRIDYLRISITDNCNLKCFYCTPFGGRSHLSRVLDGIKREESLEQW